MHAIVLRSEFPYFRRRLRARSAELRAELRSLPAQGAAAEHARIAAELEDIDSALRRIADGSFGSCRNCGKPVQRERLQELPTARECAGCGQQAPAASAADPAHSS